MLALQVPVKAQEGDDMRPKNVGKCHECSGTGQRRERPNECLGCGGLGVVVDAPVISVTRLPPTWILSIIR